MNFFERFDWEITGENYPYHPLNAIGHRSSHRYDFSHTGSHQLHHQLENRLYSN